MTTTSPTESKGLLLPIHNDTTIAPPPSLPSQQQQASRKSTEQTTSYISSELDTIEAATTTGGDNNKMSMTTKKLHPRSFQEKSGEAAELLKQLSLWQKIQVVSAQDLWHTKPIPTLGLPSIMVSDGPHGLRKQEGRDHTDLLHNRIPATCFPTASALACCWNEPLLYDMGIALRNEAIQEQVTVLLGPGINIHRHPCGGRNFEYFSEDPYLTGTLASSLICGIQSSGQVGACIKHFCINNQETWRFVVDAIVDERTMREVYMRAFEIAIAEKQPSQQPWTLMCSYNKVNGTYTSEHDFLLKQVLRNEWNYVGLTMSDWGAVHERYRGIAAGLDLEMPGSHGAHDYKTLEKIMEKSNDDDDISLTEEALDECVLRVLTLILWGKELQETMEQQPTPQYKQMILQQNHELAYQVALESCVLLKNEKNAVLPLDMNKISKFAIIGHFAKYPRYQGMGSSQVLAYKVENALDSFFHALSKDDATTTTFALDESLHEMMEELGPSKEIHFAAGYKDEHENDIDDDESIRLRQEAIAIAKESDVTILFVGLPESYESESFDRTTMTLPNNHVQLIQELSKSIPSSSQLIVVLTNGSTVCISDWIDGVGAVMESWLSGQGGGRAICDLLLGKATPSGRLAQTMPYTKQDVPSDPYFPGENHQVQHREGLNVGYRYYETYQKDVLFPFGHGLSYTTFEYENVTTQVTKDTQEETEVTVSLTVKNVGEMVGKEVVQCYVHAPAYTSKVYRPEHELNAFTKTKLLAPGATETITLILNTKAFAYWDVGYNGWTVEAGTYEIRLGASSHDIHTRQCVTITCGRIPSTQAQQTHPPRRPQQHQLVPISNISTDTFSTMLGRPIPPAADIDRGHAPNINMNSILEDLQHTYLGRLFVNQILQEMRSGHEIEDSFNTYAAGYSDDVETLNIETKVIKEVNGTKLITKTVAIVPPPMSNANQEKIHYCLATGICLRSLVTFSRGILTFEMMEWMIDCQNHFILRAMIRAPWVLTRFALHFLWREKYPVVSKK